MECSFLSSRGGFITEGSGVVVFQRRDWPSPELTDIVLGPTMRSLSLEVPGMKQTKRARNYDEEFKQDVLRLVAEGRPIVEVAENLGLRPNLISAWKKREKQKMGAVAFAKAGGRELTLEEENKALKEELRSTARERDILKKALAIFSKEPPSL